MRGSRRTWTTKPVALAAGALLACGACFLAGRAAAQDEGGGGFQMPAWAQKGPEQVKLARAAGDWDVAMKMWMMPGQPPQESKGSAHGEMLYDGRFLKQTFHGEMMGIPFEGTFLGAYDRVDSEYVAIWFDSMSTYMSVSRGKAADGSVTYTMNDPDWMTGQKKETKMVQKWVDDDTYTLDFLDTAPDGTQYTAMQFTYTRHAAQAEEGGGDDEK